MSSVNVDYEDLIRFKSTLERNAQQFDEIRQSIGNAIQAVVGQSEGWQDAKSEQFSTTFFGQSDPDIRKLVETMMGFANYLQPKIEALMRYHATNI